jgi:hypothetical protein
MRLPWHEARADVKLPPRGAAMLRIVRAVGLALLFSLPARAAAPDLLPFFEPHSGFWLNLHHVLYAQARKQRDPSGKRLWGPPPFELLPGLDSLPAAQRAAWSEALQYYSEHIVERDLLFDDELDAIKHVLAGHETDLQLADPGLPIELEEVLNRAAPIYRATGWPQHSAANRAWIASQAGRVKNWGPALTKELAGVFATRWPSAPIRVDVVAVADWAGAYTSVFPIHIVIGSLDPRNQGVSGTEILFHESSHGLIGPIRKAIARLDTEHRAPRDLWHVALFVTVGKLLERRQPGYVPYVVAQKIWPELTPMVLREWQPYLDGKTDLDGAIRKALASIPAPAPSGADGGR